jgi:hypothetical protein
MKCQALYVARGALSLVARRFAGACNSNLANCGDCRILRVVTGITRHPVAARGRGIAS